MARWGFCPWRSLCWQEPLRYFVVACIVLGLEGGRETRRCPPVPLPVERQRSGGIVHLPNNLCKVLGV